MTDWTGSVAYIMMWPYGGASGYETLWTTDLASGASTSVPLAQGYILGGATHDGYVLGAYWTGTVEQVDLIDPATGIAVPMGNLGSLGRWSGQMVYDGARDILYAMGTQTSSPFVYYLYSLFRNSGAVVVTAAEASACFAGLTNGGKLVTYDGSQVALLDPSNGVQTAVGPLGGFSLPANECTLDPTANAMYAVGIAATQLYPTTLYGTSLSTGNTTTVQTAEEYAVLAHQQN